MIAVWIVIPQAQDSFGILMGQFTVKVTDNREIFSEAERKCDGIENVGDIVIPSPSAYGLKVVVGVP